MKEITISSCGTVTEVDLTADISCHIKVLLGNAEVRRILDATLEVLPDKQRETIHSQCRFIIKSLLSYGKELEISIVPVTNKEALQESKTPKF